MKYKTVSLTVCKSSSNRKLENTYCEIVYSATRENNCQHF